MLKVQLQAGIPGKGSFGLESSTHLRRFMCSTRYNIFSDAHLQPTCECSSCCRPHITIDMEFYYDNSHGLTQPTLVKHGIAGPPLLVRSDERVLALIKAKSVLVAVKIQSVLNITKCIGSIWKICWWNLWRNEIVELADSFWPAPPVVWWWHLATTTRGQFRDVDFLREGFLFWWKNAESAYTSGVCMHIYLDASPRGKNDMLNSSRDKIEGKHRSEGGRYVTLDLGSE